MRDKSIFFMCWFFVLQLISGELITLICRNSSDILLSASIAIEDEVVGAAIVWQREDKHAILIAGRLDATPAAIDLTIAPRIETWVAISCIVLDSHRIGRLYP